MNIVTGQTVYEIVRSFNPNTNEPVVPAAFTNKAYLNGILNTGTTIAMSLSDSTEGLYTATWSASTVGTYQLHIENDTTDVVYISEIYFAQRASDTGVNVYVGL